MNGPASHVGPLSFTSFAVPAGADLAGGVLELQVIAQLQRLSQLRDAGVLTDAELEAQKQRLLAS